MAGETTATVAADPSAAPAAATEETEKVRHGGKYAGKV